MQACGHKGVIMLKAGSNNSSVWVGIEDNGCGIAAANLSKIFDPFYTTKSPGEGTGLGLTICYRIVEEGQGTINVESCSGVGSSFKVIFPKEH